MLELSMMSWLSSCPVDCTLPRQQEVNLNSIHHDQWTAMAGKLFCMHLCILAYFAVVVVGALGSHAFAGCSRPRCASCRAKPIALLHKEQTSCSCSTAAPWPGAAAAAGAPGFWPLGLAQGGVVPQCCCSTAVWSHSYTICICIWYMQLQHVTTSI